ncbi:Na/Pi cotransporter family protein [Cohnella thailandensis]|uniref:Na/Pi cotransporter family protein n=1 Tax=Cohnella thailandensis TaxID=557557 RepID=A0A841T0Y1_9BACL|nr:Na/Pi symporter [Cohnella thailandensis]MBB6636215.1 Na/Pi cotransporter family protein [Cohnella thailandensis]MBP1973816.1 phosphate:Na+ symporter [Cohnella thailandensis]
MIANIVFASTFGLALLLFGMKLMEAALRQWAGSRLPEVLGRTTSTPLKGFLTGTLSSATLQSGTAVTVITIGLVNAGLLPLGQTLGIILGTNVGTCLTTELMSLRLHDYGIPVLLVALAAWGWTALAGEMQLLPRLPKRWIGPMRFGAAALAGFGLLLIGFAVLQSIGPQLLQSSSFLELTSKAEAEPIWGVLGGAALTAAVHSSAAVIGMSMGLANSGALSPETGIAIVLGANVGTCFTGLLASLGGGKGGRFVALAQIALNVSGAALFYPFMSQLLAAASAFAPDDPAAQIAHGQTIFNIACSLLVLPFAQLMYRRGSSGAGKSSGLPPAA